MNLTVFATDGDVFANCECIKGYSFKMVAPRGKSTHLESDFAVSGEKSALLTIDSAAVQDRSVHMTVLNASHHGTMS